MITVYWRTRDGEYHEQEFQSAYLADRLVQSLKRNPDVVSWSKWTKW